MAATQLLPSWNLEKVKSRAISEGFDENRVNDAIIEYKKFAFLAKIREPGDYLCPPGIVDEIWHLHILHTKDYHNDTITYFGKYFHHNPFDASDFGIYQFDKYGIKYNQYFEKDEFMKMFPNQGKCDNEQFGPCNNICQSESYCVSNCTVCNPGELCNP